jgi:hypothetical protein
MRLTCGPRAVLKLITVTLLIGVGLGLYLGTYVLAL